MTDCSTATVAEVAPDGSIRLAYRKLPPVEEGDVLVHVSKVALNHRDVALLSGGLPTGTSTSCDNYVPCTDAYGVVGAVGDGVRSLRAGDRVSTTLMPLWRDGAPRAETLVPLPSLVPGVLSTTLVCPEAALVKVPDAVTGVDAAAIVCSGATAWRALHATGRRPGPGDWVLLTGTGGVALHALRIAKAMGAQVAITSGSEVKRRLAVDEGADATLDSRANWVPSLVALTGGRGASVILDSVGGPALDPLVQACAVGGTIALVGFVAGAAPSLPLGPAIRRAVTFQSISAASRADHEAALAFAAEQAGSAVVDSIHPLSMAEAAFRRQASGLQFGKVLIDLDQPGAR